MTMKENLYLKMNYLAWIGGAPLIRRVEIARPHVANVDIGHSLEFSQTKFVRNTNCVEHQVVQKKPTKPFVNVVTM